MVPGTATLLRVAQVSPGPANLLGLSLAGASIPLLSWGVSALPGLGLSEADAVAGFILGLVPACLLAAHVVFRPPSTRVALALLALGLPMGTFLAAGDYFYLAAPFKVVGAAALGWMLGREVSRPSWLLAAAAVAFTVDLWSVFAGPTRAVVEEVPQALDYLLVHFASPGGSGALTALGISDFVFLALLTAGAVPAGLRPRASFLGMSLSFVLTLALALLLGRPLPALPLLALAFLAVNADRFLAPRPGGGPSAPGTGRNENG